MIEIRPIRTDEIPAAKRIVYSVAYRILGWDGTLEDSIEQFEAKGQLTDMDNVQQHYFSNRGLFLAALDAGTLVGTGAVRKIDDATAELKRMWLLEEYQGKGIGYRLITRLFDFARGQGYERIILETSIQQERAIAFYRQIGFIDMQIPDSDEDDLHMEIKL